MARPKIDQIANLQTELTSTSDSANNRVLKTGDTMTGQLNVSSGGLIVQSNDSDRAAFIRSPTRTLRITPYYNSEGNDKGTWLEAINTSNAAYNKFTLSGSNIILDAGKVGVGVSLPSSPLDVKADDVTTLGITLRSMADEFASLRILNNSGTSTYGELAADYGGSPIYLSSAGAISLKTNNNDRVYITATGNVGIGTTDPTANLHVTGTIKDTPILSVTSSGTYADNAAGRVIFANTTSAITITAAAAATAGFSYTVIRGNTGNVTIANSGVTRLNSASITTMNVNQYGAVTVVYTATNQVIVFGDFV